MGTPLLFSMPPARDPAAVLLRVADLRTVEKWEHSGDRTLAMAIADPYHLVVQKQFGRVVASITVGTWSLSATLPQCTIAEGCGQLLDAVVRLLDSTPEAPTELNVDRQLDPTPREPKRWGQNKYNIPWTDLLVGERYPVSLPPDCAVRKAYLSIYARAYKLTQLEERRMGAAFKVLVENDEITVTRTR